MTGSEVADDTQLQLKYQVTTNTTWRWHSKLIFIFPCDWSCLEHGFKLLSLQIRFLNRHCLFPEKVLYTTKSKFAKYISKSAHHFHFVGIWKAIFFTANLFGSLTFFFLLKASVYTFPIGLLSAGQILVPTFISQCLWISGISFHACICEYCFSLL